MYRGITIRLYHPPDRARLLLTLQRLRNAGADSVSIVPHNYSVIRMDPGNPKHDALPLPAPLGSRPDQYVFADLDEGGKLGVGLVGNTTPIEEVHIACELAQGQGYQVLLKPHVDPLYWHSSGNYYPAGWRGNMELADADAFPPLLLRRLSRPLRGRGERSKAAPLLDRRGVCPDHPRPRGGLLDRRGRLGGGAGLYRRADLLGQLGLGGRRRIPAPGRPLAAPARRLHRRRRLLSSLAINSPPSPSSPAGTRPPAPPTPTPAPTNCSRAGPTAPQPRRQPARRVAR